MILTKILFFLFITTIPSLLFSQADTVKTYYLNNKIESVIPMLDSLKHGLSMYYFENGNLKEERPYINGKVEGVVKQYYENGKLKELFSIYRGKREGITTYYDENSGMIENVKFINGKIEVNKVPFYVDKNDDVLLKKTIKKITEKRTGVFLPPKIDEDDFKDDPAYYVQAEVIPETIGGMEVIYKKLYYPRTAIDNDISGSVEVKTYINKKGKVTKTEIVKGLGHGCDESAEIAIKYSRFNPGLIRGQKVNVQMIIKLEFKLD